MTCYEPDILAPALEVVFCGLNPATSAALAGHNFAHRSNRFWTVLHLAGFTDMRLEPQQERRLLDYCCGITAAVSRPTRRAAEVSRAEYRKARLAFEGKMQRYAPRSIAFLGKRGVSAMFGQSELSWGRLSDEFAGTMTWILPNPRGSTGVSRWARWRRPMPGSAWRCAPERNELPGRGSMTIPGAAPPAARLKWSRPTPPQGRSRSA